MELNSVFKGLSMLCHKECSDIYICATLFLLFFFFYLAQQPPVGHGLLIHEVSRSHTTTHHNRYDSSGRAISSSRWLLPDNTQHSKQTNIHAPGGIRTHSLSRRAAADLRLRPRGHWGPHLVLGVVKWRGGRWAKMQFGCWGKLRGRPKRDWRIP